MNYFSLLVGSFPVSDRDDEYHERIVFESEDCAVVSDAEPVVGRIDEALYVSVRSYSASFERCDDPLCGVFLEFVELLSCCVGDDDRVHQSPSSRFTSSSS